eukprot:TRINITY_DN5962_c0_g1_i1.p1 TRINITY_DN5962_c0_g1~~TRINITY_DN5962_c0_g1_i1.p1  ORF type:complete len:111 (+),score=28.42 TRINITY_DN5962_c0_g1_i1:426-758(+)
MVVAEHLFGSGETEMVKNLLRWGADPTISGRISQDKLSCTPIEIASTPTIISTLKEAEARRCISEDLEKDDRLGISFRHFPKADGDIFMMPTSRFLAKQDSLSQLIYLQV